MKPMGRKKIQMPNAKHKVTWHGKKLTGWWEDIVNLCKNRDRQLAKKEIEKELIDLRNG